jgi:hypothetical protein
MDIPVESVRELAAKLYTLGAIAAKLGISHDTLQRRLKEPEFRAAYEEGRELGCIKVLDNQLEVALEGNVPMLIHLGKHYLNQRDQLDQTISAPGGEPMQIEIVRVSVEREIEPPAAQPQPRLNGGVQ